MDQGTLYYGDNLYSLRERVRDESVDLCYIDPPFNSKRAYNQIYNNIGFEDHAQAQAFIDTWVWDARAQEGFQDILSNVGRRFSAQTIDLIQGLFKVLKAGSLMAYLVSMALRIVEIHRVLRCGGSFYLHCDPTASHYLKLLGDSIFCPYGGEFVNEIIWCYSIGGKSKDAFGRKHDVLLFFGKGRETRTFNRDGAAIPRKINSHMKTMVGPDGRLCQVKTDRKSGKVYYYPVDDGKIAEDYWTDIETLNRDDAERLGYPTQKPEALLERILRTSSNPGDVILDAYCGCGTTVAVAQRLDRQWIGMDITYQSISLVLRRLEGQYGSDVLKTVSVGGTPCDMDGAIALAHKRDDRLRKEFEKWAILTYTNNRAIINEKKGADNGIDGTAYFQTGATDNAKVIFQVKSGNVGRNDVATLSGDMARDGAAMAVFITLNPYTSPMVSTAKAAGTYHHDLMGKFYDRIQLVTVQDIIEQNRRLDLPMSLEVLKAAQVKPIGNQLMMAL